MTLAHFLINAVVSALLISSQSMSRVNDVMGNCGAAYIVQRGDNLTRIAARCGTTVGVLARLNRIHDPNRIFVGQRLVLSMPSVDIPPAPQGLEIISVIDLSHPDPRCTAPNVEAAAQLPADCAGIVIGDVTPATAIPPFWDGVEIFAHCVYTGPQTAEAILAWSEELHDGKLCPYPVNSEQ